MKHVVLFGNCQADALAQVMGPALPEGECEVAFLSNNAKTGGMRPIPEILAALDEADVVIYQPLHDRWGELSAKRLRPRLAGPRPVVTFPYILNRGVAGLSASPWAQTIKYGAFGEEMIVELIEDGCSTDEIKGLYRNGKIDFDLRRRFAEDLEGLRKRSADTDIQLADFVHRNYRRRRLMLTHNHPSTPLLIEIAVQIADLTGLSVDERKLHELEGDNAGGLPEGLTPVSPFDAAELRYEWDPDPDWAEGGSEIIDRIAEAFPNGRERQPSAGQTVHSS